MDLKIVSFNIRCCDDQNGNSIQERAPRLFDIIDGVAPDLIGLQEYRPQWEPYVENHFLKDYEMFVKYRNLTEDVEAGPILWRKDKFDCIKTGYFWLSDTPEVESRGWDAVYHCYRMCVYAILKEKSTGKVFTFMNTHFGFGDDGQVASAELIYQYSKKISGSPTFITGDFNMCPADLGYQKMVEYFTDVNAATVNDTRNTWHAYDPAKHPEAHIDYCFIDEQITPLHQRIMDETVDGKYPSDHYGLEIDIRL